MEAASLRPVLHAMWGSVAAGWRENAAFVDERSRPLTERMLAVLSPQPGERAIELACGPGTLGLALAPLVGPDGEVVVSDVAEEMVAIAADRAAAAGLDNVRAGLLDVEDIAEPDASFDVAVCREGLMLVPDPARAAGEIARILRPGGRAAISVWGPREHNPWLSVIFEAVGDVVGAPVPPPGLPQPFSLDDAGTFKAALQAGEFADVTVEEVEVPLHAPSVDEWWRRTLALAGPLAAMVGGLPEDARARLLDRLQEGARPYLAVDGVAFPGVVLLATARR
jgi:SAM-dependent methyltransferase